MVITDCAFEKYPLIDPDSVEHAESNMMIYFRPILERVNG
jgi:hypothetical protein